MRVLWVVNHVMPGLADELKADGPTSGSWLVELAKGLSCYDDVQLHIVCPYHHSNIHYSLSGVTYHTLQMSSIDRFIAPSKSLTKRCSDLLDEIDPDIVHIHGSEFAYPHAFLRTSSAPVVISIQGLISQISNPMHYWAGIEKKHLFSYVTPNNLLVYLPLYAKYLRSTLRAKAEIKQFELCKYRIGRTNWDHAHTYYYNKDSQYFHLQETIRAPFLRDTWNLASCSRFSVFCATGYGSPLKGAHHVLKCIAKLREDVPDIIVRIPGDDILSVPIRFGYQRYLRNLIKDLELESCVRFLG